MGNVTNLMYDGVVELPGAGPQYANDPTAKNIPGMLIRRGGKQYKYVQFDNGVGNVAAVAGGVAYWKQLNPALGIFIVTSDQTDSAGGVNAVAGIFGTVVTDQYFTWVQVGGTATCLVAASTVASDKMIGSATDLTFARIAAAGAVVDNVFGIALDNQDTTNGTATVLLQNLAW